MFSIGVPVLVAFFLWEWYHDHPIVDVRLLKNRNFGTAVFFSFVLGLVLFGTTVLIPQFLQTSLGYTAERAGMALSPGGLALMVMMPIAGFITTKAKVDPRVLVSLGFLGMATTLHFMTVIYPGVDFKTIVLLRVIQVLPMPFIFIPISTLNYIGVPREKNNQVSGLSNFSRNLGGSIGTSLLSTFLLRQNQTHQNAFVAHTSRGDSSFQAMLSGFKGLFVSQGFDPVTATHKATAMAYGVIQSQAAALSFKNSFWTMSLVIVFLVPLPFIMRRPRPTEARQISGH
jgi:DHA2 family multidrug resistance protein